MRGLRKQETQKFEKFFSIVQKEADKRNSVFFLESEEGRDFETENLEGSDLFGWLIPKDFADVFESKWKNGDSLGEWSDFSLWVIWSGQNESPEITFKQF